MSERSCFASPTKSSMPPISPCASGGDEIGQKSCPKLGRLGEVWSRAHCLTELRLSCERQARGRKGLRSLVRQHAIASKHSSSRESARSVSDLLVGFEQE